MEMESGPIVAASLVKTQHWKKHSEICCTKVLYYCNGVKCCVAPVNRGSATNCIAAENKKLSLKPDRGLKLTAGEEIHSFMV